ncbi:hypothetical protein TrRE_jg94 [Triparma retinervis]|uniref:Glycosyltransferase 2-like domain-containing protein n=1 Tax=Triparma retinervis TaxID=2557542 RepID=A0A9W7E4N7_9STRA|nr:hypothetical protein TrRE_jg94 [Triparma retinervis]
MHNILSLGTVELILVNCGSVNLDEEVKLLTTLFGQGLVYDEVLVKYLQPPVTGRGQGLNAGGEAASGDLVTFCHADTTLPLGWDCRVRESLSADKAEGSAFMFQMSDVSAVVGGLWVARCVDLRCRLFKLPYGDQTLSMRRRTWRWLGGYPQQCLMEDYEIVTLLRQRDMAGAGGLKILRGGEGVTAVCSNRRWAENGVEYVCRKNAEVVEVYERLGAGGCYERYYGRKWEGREGREEEIEEAIR